jgi:hypothetical protein
MKIVCFLLASYCFAHDAAAQQKEKIVSVPDSTKKIQIVEAACGQCQLKLPGKSCDLAVRLNGRAFFVDGTSIDDHGDAHAKDGFCEAIRKAEVQGEVVDDRYKATYFKLIPVTRKKKSTKKEN